MYQTQRRYPQLKCNGRHLHLAGITCRMPRYDSKNGDNPTNATGTSDRAGQGRLLTTGGNHSRDTRLVLLMRPSLHLGWYCLARRHRANRGTQLSLTKTSPLGAHLEPA